MKKLKKFIKEHKKEIIFGASIAAVGILIHNKKSKHELDEREYIQAEVIDVDYTPVDVNNE